MRIALSVLALLVSTPALADEPKEQDAPNKEQKTETDAEVTKDAKEERICRRVRVETGSRRKERICLTKEGWVRFNQGN